MTAVYSTSKSVSASVYEVGNYIKISSGSEQFSFDLCGAYCNLNVHSKDGHSCDAFYIDGNICGLLSLNLDGISQNEEIKNVYYLESKFCIIITY